MHMFAGEPNFSEKIDKVVMQQIKEHTRKKINGN